MGKKKQVDISVSDDYASLDIPSQKLEFYYGYEAVWCTKCKKALDHGSDDAEACEEHNQEWCFTVQKNGMEVMRVPQPELDKLSDRLCEMGEYLMAGIGLYLSGRK